MSKTTTEQREHFHHLIEQAEISLKQNPSSYRRKLGMMALLGYVYIFGILLLTLILIVLCVQAVIYSNFILIFLLKSKLIYVLLIFVYILVRALWVRLGAPQGYKLDRREYQDLFKEIDAIGKKLKAPKIHQIILTTEFNAGISQTPRLGILGWQKNTLILGLSLMMCMNKEQFLSVVAHEFGHLSANHSRFAGWIYRVRTTWMNIMDAFDQSGGWSHLVFGRFFDWYAPYFSAYSFAYARANEYDADATATELTSEQTFVDALMLTHIAPELIEKYYWGNLDEKIGESKKTESKIFTHLYERLKKGNFDEKVKKDLLEKAIEVKTTHTDTHPSLKDRITLYVKRPTVPNFPKQNAAEALFGEKLHSILGDFDSDWMEENNQSWIDRHEYLNKSKLELKELEQKQTKQDLDDDELWNLAVWTEELKPDEDVLPYYRRFQEKFPDDCGGNYAVGRLLLNQGEQNGIHYLDKAMDDHEAIIPACEMAYGYLREQGDSDKAEQYRLKAEKHMDLLDKSNQERMTLNEHSHFLPDELSDESITKLCDQFRKIDGVKKVWICQKKITVFPEEPLYLIIYKKKWRSSQKKIDHIIIDTLEMPAEYFVITNKGEQKKVAEKALRIAREIYSSA